MKLTTEQVKEVLLHIQRLNPYIHLLRSPVGQILFPRPPDADTSHQVFVSIDLPDPIEIDGKTEDSFDMVINLDLEDGGGLYD